MTYATLLEKEGINSQYLVIMKPRRVLSSSWTLVSGSIYKQTFTLGEITALTKDGTALTADTSSSVASNKFYYDTDASILYVNTGGDPSSNQMVGTYELYFGTFDAHWYRSPLDNSSRQVYYEPLITRSPQVQNSTSDTLFGFLPTFSANISISNATQFLQEHLYASSFNLADILIYHSLTDGGVFDLAIANIKLVLRGFCKEIEATDKEVNFSILDATSFFDKQYRNEVGSNFYSVSEFPDLDPRRLSKPIRQVFGVVDGFVPVNIDYVSDTPTALDNRIYVCIAGDTNLTTVSTTVKASPASTLTRTYLTSVAGFRVGDSYWNKTTITHYGKITAVGADYIDHTALGGANLAAEVIERSFVGIGIYKRDSAYAEWWYGRDYIEYIDATNHVAGFELRTGAEGVPLDIVQPNDSISVRVYGHKFSDTIGGIAFGSNSSTTGNKTNGTVILYHLLKTCLGLAETDINTSSFSDLAAAATDELGFAVPENSGEDFPTYKDLILRICQTLLLKFFLDFDNTWKVGQTAPIGTIDKTVEDDEVLIDSFSYSFSYTDIVSRIVLEYAAREVDVLGQSGAAPSNVTATSDIAQNLHLVDSQRTFKSLHFIEAEAQALADRLSFYFGDRRGMCKISSKNRFFDTELDHAITISRARLPGFAYDQSTNQDRDFAVIATQKSLNQIDLQLDDQKGIEDNSGSW